jgi:GMP synthase (glutamine-hydrolysing)
MEPRLKTRLWISALIRRCDLAAIAIAVAARGDPDAGAVLLKFNDRAAGCSVLAQARAPDGELVWMRATGAAPVAEADADAYIARQRRRDPDLWVVEIESGSVALVLDGRIL